MRKGKKTILFIGLLVLIGAWFFPSHFSRCNGGVDCYGLVYSYDRIETWLNGKDSLLENRPKRIYVCLGFENKTSTIHDLCPGSWGWVNSKPVDCKKILAGCKSENQVTYGISCAEWIKACEELSSTDKVPLQILDASQLGIMVLCDPITAEFPGGEDSLVTFFKVRSDNSDIINCENLTGLLRIRMTIDTNGRLTDLKYIQPQVDSTFQAELRNILELMPDWTPSTCKGRKIQSTQKAELTCDPLQIQIVENFAR